MFPLSSLSSQRLSVGPGLDNSSLSDSLNVNASFQQTLWSVAPIYSGDGVAQGRFDNVHLITVGVIIMGKCCKSETIIVVIVMEIV